VAIDASCWIVVVVVVVVIGVRVELELKVWWSTVPTVKRSVAADWNEIGGERCQL
jgi:hypothetical protein